MKPNTKEGVEKRQPKKIIEKKKVGAPEGNQNAVGNEGGRPPIFNNPIELENKINDYFSDCPDKKEVIAGNGTVKLSVFTISGLAYYLGFESRQSFYDYEDKVEFTYIIKRARLRIEVNYEQNLQFNNAAGSIFALKNMEWSDKHEIDQRISLSTDPFKQIRENAGLNDSDKETTDGD
jgi:hypothetical protein